MLQININESAGNLPSHVVIACYYYDDLPLHFLLVESVLSF